MRCDGRVFTCGGWTLALPFLWWRRRGYLTVFIHDGFVPRQSQVCGCVAAISISVRCLLSKMFQSVYNWYDWPSSKAEPYSRKSGRQILLRKTLQLKRRYVCYSEKRCGIEKKEWNLGPVTYYLLFVMRPRDIIEYTSLRFVAFVADSLANTNGRRNWICDWRVRRFVYSNGKPMFLSKVYFSLQSLHVSEASRVEVFRRKSQEVLPRRRILSENSIC